VTRRGCLITPILTISPLPESVPAGVIFHFGDLLDNPFVSGSADRNILFVRLFSVRTGRLQKAGNLQRLYRPVPIAAASAPVGHPSTLISRLGEGLLGDMARGCGGLRAESKQDTEKLRYMTVEFFVVFAGSENVGPAVFGFSFLLLPGTKGGLRRSLLRK